MSAFDILRFIVAAIPAAIWAALLACNAYVGAMAVFNQHSCSPVVLAGSVAGILAIVIQPFPLGEAWPAAIGIAMCPDIVWWSGALLARLLDFFRTPKHRDL